MKGAITVFSQKPVDSQKLPQVFNAILNLYGTVLIRRDGLSFIVPSSDAKSRSQEINLGEVPKEKYDIFLTEVIPLKFYSADTIQQILNPYISKRSDFH